MMNHRCQQLAGYSTSIVILSIVPVKPDSAPEPISSTTVVASSTPKSAASSPEKRSAAPARSGRGNWFAADEEDAGTALAYPTSVIGELEVDLVASGIQRAGCGDRIDLLPEKFQRQVSTPSYI